MAGATHSDATSRETIFAANRTCGRMGVGVAGAAAAPRRGRIQEAGALRVRFPKSDHGLEAVIINTAGGMTGGDSFDIDIKMAAGAALSVTSAAAEKVYRSLGADTQIRIKAEVGPGGSLCWLPQDTILFDQARLERSIEIDVARDARLILAEATVFGRSAMGETVASGHFVDRRRVRVDGRLVFAETVRLDGAVADHLAERAVASGGVAVAGMIKIPGDDEDVAKLRAAQRDFVGEVGGSAWNGIAVARLVAADGATLRRDLIGVLSAFGVAPLPRLWLN